MYFYLAIKNMHQFFKGKKLPLPQFCTFRHYMKLKTLPGNTKDASFLLSNYPPFESAFKTVNI